ncbi:MAG: ABC transporter permease [Acetobacteraceae bacterium]|nr:ABC transporter permease [Acetobacteraceae bacterium]
MGQRSGRPLIYRRHVLRSALIPVVTMVGILTGELLGGAVLVETIFSWPGVGSAVVQAIEAKDFPVVQAAVAVTSAVFVLVSAGTDVLYGLLDPRVRVGR